MVLTEFLDRIRAWAAADPGIRCVLLVGSFARGNQRPGSDIDLVVISSAKPRLLSLMSVSPYLGDPIGTAFEYYGKVTSVRASFEGGMEVEFGFADPDWASLPLDAGTSRVLGDGYVVLADKDDIMKGAGEALLASSGGENAHDT